LKPEEVFKRYDIRGEYPEEIDEDFAELLGKAYGTFSKKNGYRRVVVANDTKDSSRVLKEKLVSGLKSTGVKALDAGVGPTDYAALIGKENSAFSVQITSSHLAMETNGFKFMYPEGNSLVNEDLHDIQDIFMERKFAEGKGSVENVSDTSKDLYRGEIRKFLNENDLEPSGTVYLETMSGAGSVFLPEVLEELSVSVKHSDQGFNPPDPNSHKFSELRESVDDGKSDMGIVTDMDADRSRVYYKGKWLDGTALIAALSEAIEPEKIVASVDTSQKLKDYFDGEIEYTRVGDPFVLDKTVEAEARLSGEPNNHFAFLDFVPYNSGTVAALIITSIDLESVIEKIPKREEVRESFEVEEKDKVMKDMARYVEENCRMITEKDGIKFALDNSHVLVRKSGTSPKVRLVIDSPNREKAEEVLETVKAIIIKQEV